MTTGMPQLGQGNEGDNDPSVYNITLGNSNGKCHRLDSECRDGEYGRRKKSGCGLDTCCPLTPGCVILSRAFGTRRARLSNCNNWFGTLSMTTATRLQNSG